MCRRGEEEECECAGGGKRRSVSVQEGGEGSVSVEEGGEGRRNVKRRRGI